MDYRLRILAGIVCLVAGLAMLAFADHVAAWAPDPSIPGILLCVAAGLFLAAPLAARHRARRGIQGKDFPVRPPRDKDQP